MAQRETPSAEVTAASFDTEVLAESHTRPVVVDFWASWCAPCTQLAPLLDRAAQAQQGAVALAKVDIDANPGLARTYQVQGLPSVKAFREGSVVSEFTGVQPERVVDQFFGSLVPSEADRLVRRAEDSQPVDAEALLRRALELEADHAAATVALARLLAERGESDEARRLAERLPDDVEGRRLLAELRLGAGAGSGGELAELRQRARDGDVRAALKLGRTLAAAGSHHEALPVLMDAVEADETRNEAHETVLEIFAVLGEGHDLVRTWRPQLASALF
jgi:putative thioredoxin